MSNNPKDPGTGSPTPSKIFPRNLTARADYVVVGNPANSRPESGVDNCFPGLEFDQRNLDQRFFPGLVFYFHRADGALLIEAPLTDSQRQAGIEFSDLNETRYYIWGILGRFLVQSPDPSMLGCQSLAGMEVWRRIHDLLPGAVAVALGPATALGTSIDGDVGDALNAAYAAVGNGGTQQYSVLRKPDGKIKCIVLGELRARYLDEFGVIEPSSYLPGDLTKTMCAPWMYDFRDCYCFYWSSNKPDIVNVPTKSDEPKPYVNFLRMVSQRTDDPPFDVDFYVKTVGGQKVRRRSYELTYENMVAGWWQKLPVVLGDTESSDATATPVAAPSAVAKELDYADIVRELEYLATVEHALTVEYLYAYYSINQQAQGPAQIQQRIAAAARQVFSIAVDEMRHLMWANLALYQLNATASVGRAQRIGEPPDPARNFRKKLTDAKIKYLNVPFALNPLSKKTLDWFIEVEAPSKEINHGLDGMYVYILERLRLGEDIPNARTLVPLIKLIIDEGHGHWQRFTRVKATLEGVPENIYLRPLSTEQPSPTDQEYLDVCDSYYQLILKTIEVSVTLGRESQSQLIGAAVRVMQNLDELAGVLGSHGYLPRFTLSPAAAGASAGTGPKFATTTKHGPVTSANMDALGQLENIYGQIDAKLIDVSRGSIPEERRRANEQRRRLAAHVAEVDKILMLSIPRGP